MSSKKSIESEIKLSERRLKSVESENNTKYQDLENQIKFYTKLAWASVLIGFGISILGLIIYFFGKIEIFGFNLLGDFLGGTVASIWSLAGVFFIYIAFLGQQQQLLRQQLEINYSQLELKYTRLELEGQKIEMQEQNNTLKQQKFENTFFQLLRGQQDIVNSIDIRRFNQGTFTVASQGRDCFGVFYDRLIKKLPNPLKSNSIEKVLEAYMNVYNEQQGDLGHYFRHLYHILKFVDNSKEISEFEKFKYTSILRAQISSYELLLLFYNGIGEYGKLHFKPLLEKYSFLKNIDKPLLLNIDHTKEYNKRAFQSSKERNTS